MFFITNVIFRVVWIFCLNSSEWRYCSVNSNPYQIWRAFWSKTSIFKSFKFSPYIVQTDDIKLTPKFYQNISLSWAKMTNDVCHTKNFNGHIYGLNYCRTFRNQVLGSNHLFLIRYWKIGKASLYQLVIISQNE